MAACGIRSRRSKRRQWKCRDQRSGKTDKFSHFFLLRAGLARRAQTFNAVNMDFVSIHIRAALLDV